MPTPERVQVYKHESTAEGGQDAQDYPFPTVIMPQEDALESAGLYIQDGSNRDLAVLIKRAGNDMSFTDPSNGTLTLAQLSKLYDFLLENEPPSAGSSESFTRVGGKLTKETWTRTVGSTTWKTIDYTYTGNLLTTEVRKVFATDGITVVAQLTLTYSYSGNVMTGVTRVRNV